MKESIPLKPIRRNGLIERIKSRAFGRPRQEKYRRRKKKSRSPSGIQPMQLVSARERRV